jgi:LysM repeat protein
MRAWTTSACVALAWTLMLATLIAVAGLAGAASPAQANTRTTSSTNIILTSICNAAAPAAQAAAPAAPAAPAALAASAAPAAPAAQAEPATPAGPAARAVTRTSLAAGPGTGYVVQPGDTLSAIAARFGIQGGWPPLYASNLKVIGWDPGVLHPGTVLVLPGPARAHYTVAAGDTLSGIAAGLGIGGGWPALYAANRQVIGSNPGVLQPGTVLRLPRPAAAHPSGVTPSTHPAPPPPPPPEPAPVKQHRHPGTGTAAAAAGMPGWLKTMLIAVGLLILVALLTEPVLAALRRRQAAGPAAAATASPASPASPAGQLRPAPAVPDQASIVLADHDRLVVTCNTADETVYVLRPPGEDPRVILRVARLVLPEGPYWELARQLGVPAVEPVD